MLTREKASRLITLCSRTLLFISGNPSSCCEAALLPHKHTHNPNTLTVVCEWSTSTAVWVNPRPWLVLSRALPAGSGRLAAFPQGGVWALLDKEIRPSWEFRPNLQQITDYPWWSDGGLPVSVGRTQRTHTFSYDTYKLQTSNFFYFFLITKIIHLRFCSGISMTKNNR